MSLWGLRLLSTRTFGIIRRIENGFSLPTLVQIAIWWNISFIIATRRYLMKLYKPIGWIWNCLLKNLTLFQCAFSIRLLVFSRLIQLTLPEFWLFLTILIFILWWRILFVSIRVRFRNKTSNEFLIIRHFHCFLLLMLFVTCLLSASTCILKLT